MHPRAACRCSSRLMAASCVSGGARAPEVQQPLRWYASLQRMVGMVAPVPGSRILYNGAPEGVLPTAKLPLHTDANILPAPLTRATAEIPPRIISAARLRTPPTIIKVRPAAVTNGWLCNHLDCECQLSVNAVQHWMSYIGHACTCIYACAPMHAHAQPAVLI